VINPSLYRDDVQAFIKAQEDVPITSVILKGSPFKDVSIQEIAQQLEGRNKAKYKLPEWYDAPHIIYPPKLNIEQTSSQQTAQYKASLMTGETLLDCTGGLGVDSYYFSKVVDSVTHVELDADIHAFAKANFEQLEAANITTLLDDGIAHIARGNKYDTIYIDPSRRNDAKGKVFMLADCLPNVPEHLPLLLESCNTLWIKTAPLLDITAGLKELKHVSAIFCVAYKNEMKELLWQLNPNFEGEVTLRAVNITPDHTEIDVMTLTDIEQAQSNFSVPQTYLYEANASLYKAGAFNWISLIYNLAKLHPFSHLYTSNEFIDFPGRRFNVKAVLPVDKKLKKTLGLQKANITTRNFPKTVAVLRKELKIKDGGATYLFFTTLSDETKVCVHCSKI